MRSQTFTGRMLVVVLALALGLCFFHNNVNVLAQSNSTCGLPESLWTSSCTPFEMYAIIDVVGNPSPYALVNSAAAYSYLTAIGMNTFQFPTVTPPADANNFTVVLNLQDTQIPAGVALYWGTDGSTFPNFIGALIDPENATTPYGDYNTYTLHFTTGQVVPSLSVVIVGFNNPSFIFFGPFSLLANYNSSLVISYPPPYTTPFPVLNINGVAGDQIVQLSFTAYAVRAVSFLINILQYSQSVGTVSPVLIPDPVTGLISYNVTGLTNFVEYQFTITVVDVLTGATSQPAVSGLFMPIVNGTVPPCGALNSLWAYTSGGCIPPVFYDVIDVTGDPSPYGLVNSPVAVAFCQAMGMNFYQFDTVTPPANAINFTLYLDIQDTQSPSGIAAYWGTDGINFPNLIGALIDPVNGTNPNGINTYKFYFTTGQWVGNLSVALVGFNDPGYLQFGPSVLLANSNTSVVISTPPPYVTPFPVIFANGITGNQSVQIFFNVYTARNVYFTVYVFQNSQIFSVVNTAANSIQPNGVFLANFNATGLTNWANVYFIINVVDVLTGSTGINVTSGIYQPHIPGTSPPCGLPGSLWTAVSCQPYTFGAVINLVADPYPYGLVNSGAAVAYTQSLGMNTFQFATINPPANTNNFTLVMNIQDTQIPAGLAVYWGTDGINFPNFIAGLPDPENATTPFGQFNTYTFDFSTGRVVANLSVIVIGFNNPGFIEFGPWSLLPSSNLNIVAPAPYLIPFPVQFVSGTAGNQTVRLFFHLYTVRSVYFVVTALQNSVPVYTVTGVSTPVALIGLTSFTVTGLTNFVTYQFIITVVDALTGLQSRNVTTGPSYTPFVPPPPCGLAGNLWDTSSPGCTPPEFGAIIDTTGNPSPYFLVNSPVAFAYCSSIGMNVFQYHWVAPPANAVNFTLWVNIRDTLGPAALAAYWGTDGINYPNFIGALIDPENATTPVGSYNVYQLHFNTGRVLRNLSVALVGFNNPSWIVFGANSLLANFNTSIDFSSPPPYAGVPFPVHVVNGISGDGSINLIFTVYSTRSVYFIVHVLQNSLVISSFNGSTTPIQFYGTTQYNYNATGLINWVYYQFTITVVDAATGLTSHTVTSGSYQPHIPGTYQPCGLAGNLWDSRSPGCTPSEFGAIINIQTNPSPYALVNSPVAAAYLRSIGMNTFQFSTVFPQSNAVNFTLILNIYDTLGPAGVAAYWGTDGLNFPNFIGTLVDPENATTPFGLYNTYSMHFTTGQPLSNFSVIFIGFNNPSYIQFGPTTLYANFNSSINFSPTQPLYTAPFPVTITNGITSDRTVDLYFNVYSVRSLYFIINVLLNSQVVFSVNTAASPQQFSGVTQTNINITGLINFNQYQFSVIAVDVLTGNRSGVVTSSLYMPHIPGTYPPCGLPGNLWDSRSPGCTPYYMYGGVDVVSNPSPYGLVNSPVAMQFCRASFMYFFQFALVTPPANANNFTFVLNIRDTLIPAGVGAYWGTDGVNFPNFIGALVDPLNATTPYGQFNTYSMHFSTGTALANFSVALVGFNNPSYIQFGPSSIYANFNTSLDFTGPTPYITPFPARVSYGNTGNQTVQIFFNVYSVRSVYYIIYVVQNSQIISRVSAASTPIQPNGVYLANYTATGLINWANVQFIITIVDVATSLTSHNLTTGIYQPHIPGTSPPCGLVDSLWSATTNCQPYEFGAILSPSNTPSPYGLINSPSGVVYCRALNMNFYQFTTITPPTGVTNFTLVMLVEDTQIPAGVAAYWGTDGVNYPNMIAALIDPDNGTDPLGVNTYYFSFTTGQYVSSLAIALVGFNTPGYIYFGAFSLLVNSNGAAITTPPVVLNPYPIRYVSGTAGNQTVQIYFDLYSVRSVYLFISVLSNSQVVSTRNTSATPILQYNGYTNYLVTGLPNFVTYQFVITVVDVLTGLKSQTVTTPSFYPNVPTVPPTTSTTTTTTTTRTTTTRTTTTSTTTTPGLPSPYTSSCWATFSLDFNVFADEFAVSGWATIVLPDFFAPVMNISMDWFTITVRSITIQQPSNAHKHIDGIMSQRLNQNRGFKPAANQKSWLVTIDITIDPLSPVPNQHDVDGYANTLVTALNTPNSLLDRQLASEAVTVVSAAVKGTTPTAQDSGSSDFFSTAWHAGVIAAVIVVGVVLLAVAAYCFCKRSGNTQRRSSHDGPVSNTKSGMYATQLGNEKETDAIASDEEGKTSGGKGKSIGASDARAVQMTEIAISDTAGSHGKDGGKSAAADTVTIHDETGDVHHGETDELAAGMQSSDDTYDE